MRPSKLAAINAAAALLAIAQQSAPAKPASAPEQAPTGPAHDTKIYRQQERRELFFLNFERISPHFHKPHDSRCERRNRARAYAVGQWRKLNKETAAK